MSSGKKYKKGLSLLYILDEDIRVGERQLSGTFRRHDRSSSRPRSGSRPSTNRERIRCFKWKEYNHFAKDFPNMLETEKDQTEQKQQILDSEDNKTASKFLAANTYKGFINTDSEEAMDDLNSWRVRMKPLYFHP